MMRFILLLATVVCCLLAATNAGPAVNQLEDDAGFAAPDVAKEVEKRLTKDEQKALAIKMEKELAIKMEKENAMAKEMQSSGEAPTSCKPNTCKRRGKCSKVDGGVECKCRRGFQGPYCQYKKKGPEDYVNLSLGMPTSQEFTKDGLDAYLAVDGFLNYDKCAFTHHRGSNTRAWWAVDTGNDLNYIGTVTVTVSPTEKDRMIYVEVSSEAPSTEFKGGKACGGGLDYRNYEAKTLECGLVGRWVIVARKLDSYQDLSVCQVVVMGYAL